MKKLNVSKKLVKAIAAFIFISHAAIGQFSIQGDSPVNVNVDEDYYVTNSSGLLGNNWSVSGSGMTYTIVSGQSTPNVKIRFTSVGTAFVNYNGFNPSNNNAVILNKQVTVNGTVVGPVTITPNLTERCQGGGTTDFNASATNATGYSWSIANAGSSSINSSTGVVSWSSSFSGTARITVTASGPNNSSSTAFRDVTVTPSINPLSLNLSASSTTVCSGQSETLSVFGASGNSYELLRNNVAVGSAINGSNTTINWTASSGGDYRIRASKQTGSCPTVLGNVTTLNAVQNVGTFSITGGTSLRCRGGGTSDFNASASNATNYVWSISNAGSSTINSSNGVVTWHNSFSGTATVSVTASNSCNSRTVTRNVTVSPPPNTSYTLSGTSTLCSGSSGTITLSDSQTGVDYELKRGSQTIATLSGTGNPLTWTNSTITAGTYNVTASNGVCVDETLTSQWTIGSTTANDISINSSSGGFTNICPGQVQLFPVNTTTITNWTGVDSWTSTNAVVNIAAGQSITVTLYATNNCNVSQDISVTLSAVAAPSGATITSGALQVCQGTPSTNYNATASNFDSDIWELDPISAGTIDQNGTVSWNATYVGQATVTYRASNSCNQSDSDTRTVTVSPPPNTSYTLSGTSTLCSGSSGTITLSDSQTGVDYELKRGSQTIATLSGTGNPLTWTNSTITAGTYNVTASNGVCVDETLTSQWTIGSTTANDISINSSSGGFTNICPGQVQLFPVNTTTITNWTGVDSWTSTNAVVNIAAGQSITVTLYATNNCNVSQEEIITLVGATGPSGTTIDSGDTQVCQGTSQSVYVGSADNASSHAWSIDPISAGTIDQNGTVSWNNGYMGQVTITYEASNNCNQMDTAEITVDVTNTVTFYEDKDRDGFYIGSVQGCENPDPLIYVTQGSTIGSGDCDDNDEVLNPNTVWYEDTDGDGLGDPNVTLVQCERPTGYVLTPDLDGPLTEDPLPDLSGLDTQDMNTTFSVEPYTPTTSLSQIDALPADGKMASRTYYDGMGRPVQEVALHAGGISYGNYTGNDIVNYIEYDRFGRTIKRFSPYGKLDQTAAGDFEPEAKGEQIEFYATGNLQNSFVQTSNPFSETVFDRSPRNRAIRQASPGDNWSVASGNVVSTGYFFNEQDEVRYFKVNLDNDLIPTLVTDGYYLANELVKTVVRDENWTSGVENTAEEFVNKDGQTVLKRTYVGGETLSTYYVYDDYGNLTYVLPPKTEPDTETITTTLLNSLAFQYRYDALRRQVEKRNPGVDGWERIVYDYEDRPILAQDANMAINDQWLFTKYDKYGRPVYTGFYNSTQSRTQLQQLADDWVEVDQKSHNEQRTVATTPVGGTAINYSNEAFPDSNLELLSINYYDDYNIVDSDLPITPSIVMGQNVTTNTKGLATISWVRVLDGQPNSWNKTYTYYDERARALRVQTKNFQQGFAIVDNELDFRGKVVEMTTEHQKDFQDPLVSIRDSYTYDHMERIRTQSQALYDGSFNGGTPIENKIISGFLYDALGQLTKKYVEPESDNFGWQVGLDESTNPVETPNSNDPTIVVSRDFNVSEAGIYDVSYDFSGDTSGVAYSIVLAINRGSALVYRENLTQSELANAINFVAATSGTYTVELSFRSPNGSFLADSNFTTARIGLAPNTTLPAPSSGLAHKDVPALQVVDYQYNARGSMTQINDVDDLQNDLFAYRMHYDEPTVASGATPMYNGNVAQVQWKTQNDGVLRGYSYTYDALSRLTGATDNTGNYNISNISYDKNGNLLTLNRKGWGQFNGSNTFGDIDVLDYTSYEGNKLLKVVDGGNAAEGFRYNSAAPVDYSYDANGNMISDTNKGVVAIEYNHLDLPEKVTFTNGDEIRYLYDAMGTKLRKTAVLNNNPTITEYWNGFQYTMGELQFFAQPEGYVAVGETSGQRGFDYVYHYSDHLGNVRLSYSDTDGNGTIDAASEIINENNYYPFGMLHKGYNTGIHPLGTGYTYGFGGKELQEDGGLAWLDFGSRNYDPALGRWMNIDPQAGRYMSISPFAAMGNNPVTFVDPNGEELVTTLIAGAVIGAWLGGATTAIMGGDINDIGRNMLIGGLAGLASAGTAAALTGGTNAVISGTGFWNGAAVGGSAGFAGGFTSGSLHAAFSGGSFGDVLSGGLNSGVVGGLSGAGVGGVLGGLNATSNGREFWSGKKWLYGGSNYEEVFREMGARIAELDAKWDIEAGGKLKGVAQIDEFDCGVACKETVDNYFGKKPIIKYKDLRTVASGSRGISSKTIMDIYSKNGYTVTPLKNGYNYSYKHEQVLTFLESTFNQKGLAHFAFKNSAGNHFGVAHKVKYLSDFSKYKIFLWDPASGGFQRVIDQTNFYKRSVFGVFGINK
ncbi:DUF6443 domain-containing protein [uncultured Croceitalea sp.]|uniref:DUF6443 domain-containing protein n=1 Tax=uncultured Croceitalea sp. TaxID=1798908 RepID=UPI0033067268